LIFFVHNRKGTFMVRDYVAFLRAATWVVGRGHSTALGVGMGHAMQSLLFLEKGFLSVRYTPGGLTHGFLLEEKLA
jgi:hypothetical protein